MNFLRSRTLMLAALTSFVVACGHSTVTPDGGNLPDGGHVVPDGGMPDAGPVTQSVHGTTTYAGYNQPLVGATVSIGSASTTTADDGTFTIDNVTAPYDLRVTFTSQTKTFVNIFEALTRTDPTLEVNTFSEAPLRSASVSGTLSGITFPLPAGHVVAVVTTGVGNGTSNASVDNTGAYSFVVGWKGGATTVKNIYAIEYSLTSGGLFSAFGGYAKISPTLTDNGTYQDRDIALAAVPSGNANVLLTEPVAVSGAGGYLGITFEQNCSISHGGNVTGAFSGFVPNIPGVTNYAAVFASFNDTGGSVYEQVNNVTVGSTTSLSTQAPLVLTPDANSAFPAGSRFGWDAHTHGVYALTVSDLQGANTLVIYTARNQVSVPTDLALPSGSHSWTVEHLFLLTDTDQVAVPYGTNNAPGRNISSARTVNVP